jgi:glycoside/pentoside/hexuronide:cation symporter, GPH family
MPATDQQRNWRALIGFSSPVFPFAGQEIAAKVFLPIYLAQATHVSVAALAGIFLIYRVWDTLNDPLIGWLSDHWPRDWRWGHRRLAPMMLGAPIALAGLCAVLLVPGRLSPWATSAALIVAALGWTLVNVPHGAWALEIGTDSASRTRVFAARQVIGLIALPLFALGPGVLEHIYGADNRRDAAILAGIMAVSLPLSLWWLARVTRGDAARAARGGAGGRARLRSLPKVFAERRSLWLLALFACLGVHAEVKDALLLFWVRDSLHLPNWGWSMVWLQAVTGLASVPLWLWVQRRLGTCHALQVSLAATALVTTGFVLVPAGALAGLIGCMVVQGLVMGASFTLLRAMLGDHAEAMAARYGVQLAGTLYSGFHLAYNLAVALTLPAVLQLVARLGFDLRAGVPLAPAGGDPLPWVIGCGGALPLVLAWALMARAGPTAPVA